MESLFGRIKRGGKFEENHWLGSTYGHEAAASITFQIATLSAGCRLDRLCGMVAVDLKLFFPKIEVAITEGRILDAWVLAEGTGVPLESWPAGEFLCQAARLAGLLGAGQLSKVLHWKNWRDDRKDPRRFYRALHSRIHHTPAIKLLWEIRCFLESAKDIPERDHADLLAFQASIFVMLADFEAAGKLLDDALHIYPDSAWLRSERSSYYSAADRYDEALEEARLAVGLNPCHRSAVTRCSDALIHLGRDDEALELLEKTHVNTQLAALPIAMQLIHSERGDFERGMWCLSEIERLSPLMDSSLKWWISGRRADFHLLAGNFDEFLTIADLNRNSYRTRIAKNLRRRDATKAVRKRLDVAFTRQHRMTCAPATLSSIAAYWGVERDHLEIADAICYDGTPWHKERRWAEQNGFIAKEFRLTWDNLVSLIDRGVPFTLTTQWTTGAHLQACIGYDMRTDTVILRDPTERHFEERLFERLVHSHPMAGPRAMVMVPANRAELLVGLMLDDEHVYDSFHRLLVALETHDRLRIQAAVSELRAVAPDHALALDGEMRAANALQDWSRSLELAEKLIRRFPGHQQLWLKKCGLLLNLRRLPEQRAYLEEIVGRGDVDPVFRSDLGELLSEDARELTMADYHLRRALKHGGHEARVYDNLARCRMKQRRFAEVVALRRAASCLAQGFEPYAAGYFHSSRIIGKTAEALEYLEKRTLHLGAKDHGPWLTHARMLEEINCRNDAAVVLGKAEAAHPEDGSLLLHGGGLMVSWGPEFRQKGMSWMARARGRVNESLWLRESAEACSFIGDRVTAIHHWRSLLKLLPLDISVWRSLAVLIAEENDRKDAIDFLNEGTGRFPEFAELWGLSAEWLCRDPKESIAVLDHYLRLMPKSGWGYRERALRRLDRNECDEALTDTKESLELEPENPNSFLIHGQVLAKMNRIEDAATAFRHALLIDIDCRDAATGLMELVSDRHESMGSIEFIENEMRRQVSYGHIVPAFQELAWRWLEPDALLGTLRGFCNERPDLWQTWSACITQALSMSLNDEARSLARSMTDAFPLMPRAWLDLAKVYQATGEISSEVEAAGKALEISPASGESARLLADALERAGDLKQAEKILRDVVARDSLNAANRGWLADLLRRIGKKEESVEILMTALRSNPFYRWGWKQLSLWVKTDGRSEDAVALLGEITQAQSHRHVWWSQAADLWMDLGRTDDAIGAVRHGLANSPDDMELREKLAWLLCESGKFDEALSICESGAGDQKNSRKLEGRRASILMESGQPVKAIQVMRDLLDREPDYVWGLGELTGWLAKRNDWSGALDAGTRWARYAPWNSYALGYVGQAQENLNNLDLAAKAYAKALVIQPDYLYAGRRLLDIQLKEKRYSDAERTLAHLRYYSPSVWLECDAVELEIDRREFDKALSLAAGILEREDAGFDVINWLDKLFTTAQRSYSWNELVERMLAAGTAVAPGALAVAIGNIPTESFAKKAYKKVKSQRPGSPLRVEGWKRMLDLAGGLHQNAALRKWSSKDRAELHSEPGLWNEMGGAFLSAGEYARGLEWMKDWREREVGVTVNTLFWIAALNDGCRKDSIAARQAAKEIRQEALRRFPNSGLDSMFRVGIAFQAAIDGDVEEAKTVLRDYESSTCTNYYVHYGKLAQAVISAAEKDEENARVHLAEAVSYFAKGNDKSAKIMGEEAIRAVAAHIPSARGSSRRLKRQWQLEALGKTLGTGRFSRDVRPQANGWRFLIFVIVVAQLFRACATQ